MVTVTHNGKPFAWSYSKLKNFESCPKRHWHVDIAKDAKEEESEQLKWGNTLHSAAAKRLKKKVALPPGMEAVEAWCKRFEATPGEILVEQKLAINKDFGKCSWFDNSAWFRAVGDVIKISGPVALIADWKTGKVLEDSQQLALSAACVFAHHPDVQRVRSLFVWLKEGPDVKSEDTFTREGMVNMWKNIWPRIQQLQNAHDTMTYPAKPGRLCRNWCPVDVCPHHGESHS
jgi:PD-(D/E)XK nuclease superfamily